MIETIKIEILLGAISFIVNTYLGTVIFFQSRSWTNRLFFVLSFLINVYIITNFISLHPPVDTPEDQLFWIRAVMFVTSFIGPILVIFAHTFPREKMTMKARYYIPLFILMTASAIASALPLVFSGITYPNGEPLPVPGPGIPIFFIDFVGLFILSFIIIAYKYFKSSGREKLVHKYLLFGVLTSFSLMALSTVTFVVVLKTTALVFLGPIFPVILMACMAYAIVKYNLFDVKVIATEIIVAVLLILLFSKVFATNSFQDAIVDSIIFLGAFIFSFLLVRSIRREVKQRRDLERLTTELKSANEKLKELDKIKSEFLSFASHQVKSPMAIVKGYAEIIRDGQDGPVSDKVKETSDKIAHSATTLIDLVNNLLDMRKIEEGKMNYSFEAADLVKLTKEIVGELSPLAEKKHLSLTFESELPTVKARIDLQKFKQVVLNFVDNAIKYTPQGWVKVKISRDPARVQNVLISVSDSGFGISKDLLPKLFQQFSRDHEVGKKILGTGLGLFIAKQIVKDHGGEVWAESGGEGRGSSFCVSIKSL